MDRIFFERVQKIIKRYNFLKKGNRVIVAISGGPDSVCLAYLLWRLRKKYGLKLHLFHFQHGLRSKKAEKRDVEVVRNLAGKLSLPLIIKKIGVSSYARKYKLSIEEAGRNLRYKFLLDFAKKRNYNRIATGHTLDDQAETILFNLIRGSGTAGLSGIPPLRREGPVEIIRPLLATPKKEIVKYLKKEKLNYSQDFTNFHLNYTRNRIRHQLLPLLEKYNPRIKKHLFQLAEVIEEEESFWEKELKKIIPRVILYRKGKIILDLEEFLCYNKIIQSRIVEYLLQNWGRKSYEHFVSLNELIQTKQSGKRIDLGEGWRAEKRNGRIYIFEK